MKKNIAALRKQLIDNCAEAQKLLQASQLLIGEGSRSITNQSTTNNISEFEDTVTKTFDVSKYDSKLIQSVRILVHAIAIQEWHIFLDEVFAQAVMHYLKGGKLSKSPSGQLELKRLNATKKIIEMRENICDSAKERFGRLGYKDRIERLRGIFGIHVCSTDRVMTKHVVIRNIFQHHRGKVRESAMKLMGEQYQEIDVIDDDGDERSFGMGKKIALSNTEIEKLLQTIEGYSEKFESKAAAF